MIRKRSADSDRPRPKLLPFEASRYSTDDGANRLLTALAQDRLLLLEFANELIDNPLNVPASYAEGAACIHEFCTMLRTAALAEGFQPAIALFDEMGPLDDVDWMAVIDGMFALIRLRNFELDQLEAQGHTAN